jgi:hypothetical protein
MNDVDRPSVSWPEKAAIALVGIPVALFLGTWFRPLIGLPAAAVAIWTAWRLMESVAPSPLPSRQALWLLAALALFWTWTAGLGGLFQQVWDHNFRNAVLHDLIDHSWPVLWDTPKGVVVLDYYLAWSLVPALAGKVLGWKAATLTLAAICAGGVFLVMLLFVRILGVWRWWVPLSIVLWSGMDAAGWILRGQFPDSMTFVESWAYPLWSLSHLSNYYCVAHLVIPSWLVTLLVVGRKIHPGVVVAASAFLIPLAPFQAIGIVPFVVWRVLHGDGSFTDRIRRCLTLENIVAPLVFIAICAPYFLANRGAGMESGWFLEYSPEPTLTTWIKYAAFWSFEILIPAAAIWMTGQRDRLLLLTVIVLCLIPLRRAGMTNDLALKVPVPALMILTLYTSRALVSKIKGWPKWFLIGVFGIGVATPLHEFSVWTYFTLTNPNSFEQDGVKTFDPAHPCPGAHERKYLINFQSRPLDPHSILRRMLARVPGTPPGAAP